MCLMEVCLCCLRWSEFALIIEFVCVGFLYIMILCCSVFRLCGTGNWICSIVNSCPWFCSFKVFSFYYNIVFCFRQWCRVQRTYVVGVLEIYLQNFEDHIIPKIAQQYYIKAWIRYLHAFILYGWATFGIMCSSYTYLLNFSSA